MASIIASLKTSKAFECFDTGDYLSADPENSVQLFAVGVMPCCVHVDNALYLLNLIIYE